MIVLEQISSQLIQALKNRDSISADALRGLKTRIQNEKIAKGQELSEAEVLTLIGSEIKKRKEASESFKLGGREELAEKELAELKILQQFLPPQLSDQELEEKIEQMAKIHNWSAAQFGEAMRFLKAEFANSADGATVARILKQKLGN